MNKRVISVMIAAGLIMSTGIPAAAKPLSETLKQQKSQLQKNKESLKKVQSQKDNLEGKVEELDSKIESMMRQVNKVEGKITKTQKEIEVTKKELKKAQEELDKEQALFNERVRAMYINGADSYLGVLLESESFSDLISRIDMVKTIVQNDKKIIARLDDRKQDVNDKKQALDTEKQKLVALKAENQNKLAKLNETKSEQTKLIAELNKQENMYNDKIADNQKLVASTLKKIQSEAAARQRVVAVANTNRTPSRGNGYGTTSSASTTISAGSLASGDVVSYATNFMGVPYVWGGTSPSGFDCSGFVQYVYSRFGVNLPRVASDQAGVGSSVSRDNLQPGDLVFFGKGYIHHVGMYVGNGCYIHAPKTGDVVKISPLNRSDYAGARRVK